MRHPPNFIMATVSLDGDCSLDDGEYTISITSSKDAVQVYPPCEDDFTKAVECIQENIKTFKLEPETYVEVLLKETGEWDPHPMWHKYYEIKDWSLHKYCD